MSTNPRSAWYVPGFFGAALLLSACGIEDFALLEPPGQIINANDKLFEFRKRLENSETFFSGFEMYYKIFQTGDSPVAVDVFTFEDLAANGYWRIHSADPSSESKPLMPIDVDDRRPPNNDEFLITLDIGTAVPLNDPFPQYDHDGSGGIDTVFQDNTAIRRGVNYTETGKEGEFKKFTEFSADDVGRDITADVWTDISSGFQVLIVVYVVSYGFDFDEFRIVYSEPVYLGEERRIFPFY